MFRMRDLFPRLTRFESGAHTGLDAFGNLLRKRYVHMSVWGNELYVIGLSWIVDAAREEGTCVTIPIRYYDKAIACQK